VLCRGVRFTAEAGIFRKCRAISMSRCKRRQSVHGCSLMEEESEGIVEIRKVFCNEWQKMSPYLVNIRNFNKNSFSILMS
jgi:hypothetical protein